MNTIEIDELRKQSRNLKGVFAWLFGVGCFLLFSEVMYMPIKELVLAIGTPDVGTALRELGTAMLRALPALTLLAALWTARSLFKSFETGELLAAGSGRTLGRLGDWLIAGAVAAIAFGPDIGPAGLAFGGYLSAHIVLGCTGLAIRLFGKVLCLAAAISADHAQIV